MDDRRALVTAILRTPAIRNKIVVLCEGDRITVDGDHAPSPQMYSRLENTPDSSFYQQCVPRRWCGRQLPRFFNCGGRSDVIYTFDALRKAHRAHPAGSHLDPDKLYAIVDIDLQAAPMPDDYPWSTTEDVHAALFEDGSLKADTDDRHRIWVTTVIHKEAFFVFPETVAALVEGVTPYFRDSPLDLRALHVAASHRLNEDAGPAGHLQLMSQRICRFAAGRRLSCVSGEDLGTSWRTDAQHASDEEYGALVRMLLAVARIKPLWSEVIPDPSGDTMLPPESYREQLALNVARAIAKLEPQAHPLASFFAWLGPRR